MRRWAKNVKNADDKEVFVFFFMCNCNRPWIADGRREEMMELAKTDVPAVESISVSSTALDGVEEPLLY